MFYKKILFCEGKKIKINTKCGNNAFISIIRIIKLAYENLICLTYLNLGELTNCVCVNLAHFNLSNPVNLKVE